MKSCACIDGLVALCQPMKRRRRFDLSRLVGTFQGELGENYIIDEQQLGAGVGGQVFMVTHKKSKEKYAAKEAFERDAGGQEGLLEEFEVLSALKHPNITKVIELVRSPSKVIIITELAEGGDLVKYIKQMRNHSDVDERWIANVFKQVMSGLAYLHEQDIVHNDLKPANILAKEAFQRGSRVPTVMIHDFGCATWKTSSFTVGDPLYQPPEAWPRMICMLNGETDFDKTRLTPAADVWSAAVTLFELLSDGNIPFIYKQTTLNFSNLTQEDHELLLRMDTAVRDEEIDLQQGCSGASLHAKELLRSMFQKLPKDRPKAKETLGDAWFKETADNPIVISRDMLSKLELKASKGRAHQILLTALASKLQREYWEECQQRFDAIDKDNSGSLEIKELLEALPNVSKEQLRKADIDGDGSLDFYEFLAATFDWHSIRPDELDKHLTKLIDQIDTDRGGSISESELSAFFGAALSSAELREVFTDIDSNGDGFIKADELRCYIVDPPTVEQLAAENWETRLQREERRESARQSEYLGGTVVPALLCFYLAAHGLGLAIL